MDANLAGAKTPDFILQAALPGGIEETVSAKGLAGKWTVIYIYPKDSTAGCTTEALEFSERAGDFEKLGAAVYGLSKDSIKSHHNFISKQGLRIPLLSDTSTEVIKRLGGWGVKKMYGKTSEGVVRSTLLLAPDGTVAKHWPKAPSRGHAQEVLDALGGLAR